MRLAFSTLSVFVGVFGVISFVFLVVAIGTDHWYIIDVSMLEHNSTLSLSSHTGLWRTCNFQRNCTSLVNPFGSGKNYTDSENQLLHMHGTFIVLLPLSVIIMIVGGMLGFIGLLARAYLPLLMTGLLLLLGSLTSLTGLSVYMAYSAMVFRLALCMSDQKTLEGVHILFGWSLTLAWLSCGSEFLTSAAFLLACRTLTQQREEQRL